MRLLGIDAAFAERSAAPATEATLVVRTDAAALTVQMLRSGPEAEPDVREQRHQRRRRRRPVPGRLVAERRRAGGADRARRERLAERRLRRADHRRRRPAGLRAARRQAGGAAGTRRGRDAHEHLGCLQLLRRGRRRLGRHVVRALAHQRRRSDPPPLELRRPLPVPQLRPRLSALACPDRQARRHHERRGPRAVRHRPTSARPTT